MLGSMKLPLEMQRSPLRAQIGSTVAQHLDADTNVLRVPTPLAEIYMHDTFLTVEECADLVTAIDGDNTPSKLYDQEAWKDYRTSRTCSMDQESALVRQVDAKIYALLGIDGALGEPLQGQRYEVGQQYKDHTDFFFTDQPYWPDMEEQGGQRTWTAMAYLNDVEEGGETVFPEINFEVQPMPGRLLVWNNMRRDGAPNPDTMHRATPVAAGCKYVITKWFRERPWKTLGRPPITRKPEAAPLEVNYSLNVDFSGLGR